MSIIKETAYTLDDLGIVPARNSSISSRSLCNPYYRDFECLISTPAKMIDCMYEYHKTLPIFTAPMPSVIDGSDECIDNYLNSNITPVVPRTVPLSRRIKLLITRRLFVAFSLKEVDYFVINKENIATKISNIPLKVCIDIANGNMDDLYRKVQELKDIYKEKMLIMSGNVANPEAFVSLGNSGCDFIKLSVGTGSACITATTTGIYMPMGTLIDECIKKRNYYSFNAKIVADGGFENYRNINKALALGADYVMLGSMLNTLKDSSGEVITDAKGVKYKIHFGMASVEGQKALGKSSIIAPEGKVIYNKISKLTIKEFSEEFTQYLRSCMSYCGKTNLSEFVGNVELRVLSPNASKQYNQTTDNSIPNEITNAQIIL